MKSYIDRAKFGFSNYFLFSLLAALFFVVLVFIAIYNWCVTSKELFGDILSKDVAALANVVERIDKECRILSFDNQKNIINFLTVTSFVSSEVGSLNLEYPKKWQGPYVDDNPTYQEKEYMVVRTKHGYFLTPGEGVVLPNGKAIGKDIVLDEDADIAAMAKEGGPLWFEDKALAVKLNISTSTRDVFNQLPMERI